MGRPIGTLPTVEVEVAGNCESSAKGGPFGGTITVDERGAGKRGERADHVRHGKRLAAGQQFVQ